MQAIMALEQDGLDLSNWTTQLRKGLLELCIVNLLAKGEVYGYDLVKQMASVEQLVVTEGTLYPLLSRLKKAGLVQSRLEESSNGPARKYYQLTPAGRRELAVMSTYFHSLTGALLALESSPPPP